MNKNNILPMNGGFLPIKYFAEDNILRDYGSWPEYAATMGVCIDAFDRGLASGRLHSYYFKEESSFLSLDQLLFAMEAIMNRVGVPQRFEEMRSIHVPGKKKCGRPSKSVVQMKEDLKTTGCAYTLQNFQVKRGQLTSFYVRVCYRQHSSMQGYLSWVEHDCQVVFFRSEMELMSLIREAILSICANKAIMT